MDKTSLPSNSYHSNNENYDAIKYYQSLDNWNDEIHSNAWDDDVHPPINYDLDISLPSNEVKNNMAEEESGNTVTTNEKPVDCLTEKEGNHIGISDYLFDFLRNHSTHESETKRQPSIKKRQTLSQAEREQKKILNEQKKILTKQQNNKKKAEQLRHKALKAVLIENQRNIKPEENLKFLKVHIDNEIINSSYGVSLISLLQENNVQYVVESHAKTYTITWSKNKTEKIINDHGDVEELMNKSEEKEVLHVLLWSKAVELIHNNELVTHIESLKDISFDKNLTVIIYGIEKYFNYWKVKRKRDWKGKVNSKGKMKTKGNLFENAPFITRDQFEFALADLQLLGKNNSRLLETPEEFSNLILNMTKSLSQLEYKLNKQKRQEDDVGWVASDSCHSVKVDKNEHGLLRLWQQQICQFSSVGVETAQAIVSQYNSPLALVNQYKLKDSKEGERLLENIKIRREAGILSSSRRIGPQLSKKMYKFFTSDDANAEL